MSESTKVRLRFAKTGDLRLVSHHDVMRCLERMLRRARLPIAFSQGFNPRPKIVFALAMGLGIEGRSEVVDLELTEAREPAEVLRALIAAAPPGFTWIDAQGLPHDAPGPRPLAVEYEVQVPASRLAAAEAALSSVLASSTCPVIRHRPDRPRATEFDLRPLLLDAELGPEGTLRARMRVAPEGSARPEELLECLGLRDILNQGVVLIRTRVEIAP